MADYYCPTVLYPPIPMADMTACERLFLTGVFDHDIDDEDESIRFYSAHGPNDMPSFEMADVRRALEAEDGADTLASRIFNEHIEGEADAPDVLPLDLSLTSHEGVIQDIIRRSPGLNYVSVTTSFMCSNMLADGFGGMAVLITADTVLSKSTEDILREFRSTVDPDGAFDGHRP